MEFHRVVVTAPTGSGKSTQVPQMILDHTTLRGKILVLEPRRIAARMLAVEVARERQTPVGREIGYMTRYESKVRDDTKIIYMTEGILPRIISANRDMSGIGVVILDEFHERSVYNDLCLGLLKRIQDKQQTNIVLVVMSATLEIELLQNYLGNSAIVTCNHHCHPVDIVYLQRPASSQPVWELAGEALRQLISAGADGDILIFMPGAFEIRKTIDFCRKSKIGEPVVYHSLHGDMPADQQDAVIRPGQQRKVIVATNVAETSLTIPGVRHVIDSGLVRVSRYDPVRGINMLHIELSSKSSADQRSGRAGREAPGRCIRLWSSSSHENRCPFSDPEIHRIDLAETVLFLKSVGCEDVTDLPWLERPSPQALETAIRLLCRLGALADATDALTELGQLLANFPTHPRIARLLLESDRRHCLQFAAMIAAIFNERPVTDSGNRNQRGFLEQFDCRLQYRGAAENPSTSSSADANGRAGKMHDAGRRNRSHSREMVQSDLFCVINALNYAKSARFHPETCQRMGLHGAACRQVWKTFEYYLQVAARAGLKHTGGDDIEIDSALMKSLLIAFPDHLAKRNLTATLVYQLADGRSGELVKASSVRQYPLILPLEIREIGGRRQATRITLSLASEIRVEWLKELFPKEWKTFDRLIWNDMKLAVEKEVVRSCHDLVIDCEKSNDIDLTISGPMLAEKIIDGKLELSGWNKEVKQWINRVDFVRNYFPDNKLPIYDDAERKRIISALCEHQFRYKDVKNKPCINLVKSRFAPDQQRLIDRMAPDTLRLPSGRRMRIQYRANQLPRGNAKIQDLFGLTDSPAIAGGKVRILIEILAPNMRPVQITDDLSGFWRNMYPNVKKELSRRYPKHKWV